MNFEELKKAIELNITINWKNSLFKVIKDNLGQYLIICTKNDNCVGLHLPTYFPNGIDQRNFDFIIN
jgi:hypothetical protein